ncbi:MAG: hypothetical protein DMD97_23290 [Candidatus Rokuibacteriota bacterium]|nr:MAG: hypothetical protein DMD97_23290 [Candidatus Rokubacteria bacterium]
MIDLGTLGGPHSEATAVNANGQIAGSSNVDDDQFKTHAFSWTPAGGMIDLGVLGDTFDSSEAVAVNDRGQVVGVSSRAGFWRAFSWTPAGRMVELPALGGTGTTAAVAVNASGQVVGSSFTTDGNLRPVLWQPIANLGCNATLAGCNLRGDNLAGAYLNGANLSGSNLRGANLTRSTLTGANLAGANMQGTNLTNANLAGANLAGANVRDVIWSHTICPDGTNSDANGGTCKGHLR